MSASREKKQRQGAGPSEKAIQVQKETAAKKRKNRIYGVVAIVLVVLIAVLLVWNSGLFQSRATAATIGDEKLSVTELSYYYYDTRYIYSMYGLVDSSKPDADQVYDETTGTSYRDFFLEQALSNAKQNTALYNAAIAAGHSESEIKDQLKAEIDAMKASAANSNYSYKSFLKAVFGRYMTPAVYEDIVAKTLLADLYANEVNAEKLNSITLEDAEAYYAEHKDELDEFEYSFLQFKAETVAAKDEDGNERTEEEIKTLTEEANAKAKAKALETLLQYEAGVSIADLIEVGEPASSGENTVVQGTTGINANFRDELLKLVEEGPGSADMVETESNGYYVVIFHNRGRNMEFSAHVRHILAKADTTTDDAGKVVAPSDEAWAAAKADAEAALAEYEAGAKTAESFGELANKYSDDTGSNTNGGLYENVTEGRFVAELNDWLFGETRPQPGDTALIRHEGDTAASGSYWGYHVIYLQDWAEPEWELDAKSALLNEIMTEWNKSLTESGYEVALANGAKHLGY